MPTFDVEDLAKLGSPQPATPFDFEQAARILFEGAPGFVALWSDRDQVTVAEGGKLLVGHACVWADALRSQTLGQAEIQHLEWENRRLASSVATLEEDLSEAERRATRANNRILAASALLDKITSLAQELAGIRLKQDRLVGDLLDRCTEFKNLL